MPQQQCTAQDLQAMHCHLHLDSPSLLPCKALPAGQLRDKLSPVRDSSTALFMLLRESCTHAQIALVHSSVPAARQIIVQPCALQQGIGGPSHAWYARATMYEHMEQRGLHSGGDRTALHVCWMSVVTLGGRKIDAAATGTGLYCACTRVRTHWPVAPCNPCGHSN